MKVFTNNEQKQLLVIKGIKLLTNVALAKELNVSRPTVSKMLSAETPMILQNNTYRNVTEWMTKYQATDTSQK